MRAKLEADLAELRHQRRLLLNVWAWYLAPCLGAIIIVLLIRPNGLFGTRTVERV